MSEMIHQWGVVAGMVAMVGLVASVWLEAVSDDEERPRGVRRLAVAGICLAAPVATVAGLAAVSLGLMAGGLI